MKKPLLFFTLLFPFLIVGQNTIGLPGIINYTKQVYKGGAQNWDIQQDENGILYFGNNEGLLCFDGSRWHINPLPNKTIVRTVSVAADKKIYVGGQGEMGYFSPTGNGSLHYTSLVPFIPQPFRSFDDVWDIKHFGGSVFFRTNGKIFQLTQNTIVAYPDKEWTFLGTDGQRLLAQNSQYELCTFSDGKWQPFAGPNEMPANSWITAYLPLNKDSSLIVTQLSGLYLFSHEKVTALQSPAIDLISQQHIYAACRAGNKNIVLGTSQHGIYIISPAGELIQSLSSEDGVQNNNVLAVFLDRDQNIWLAMDNGIDLVAYNNAVRHIYIPGHPEAAGYAALLYKNSLYMGTSNGLYQAPLTGKEDISYTKTPVSFIPNSQGQVWNLSVVNDRLLMGHNEGAYTIDNGVANRFSSIKGFWNFQPYRSSSPGLQMVAGTYSGLSFFGYASGSFSPSGNAINFESSRFVTIAADGKIWVAHPYKGLYCVPANGATDGIKLYSKAQGIPSLNLVFTLENKLLVATDSGILEYSTAKDVFVPSAYYTSLFGNTGIRYVKEDAAGNLWFVSGKRVGVVDRSKPKPEIFYIRELDNRIVSGFEFIYPYNSSNILIGGEKGFYHLNYAAYKKRMPPPVVQVSTVQITGAKDSLLFGGYSQNGALASPSEISYSFNSIHFEYTTAVYGDAGNVEYSYLLESFDKTWSDWTNRTEKDYTNLPPGRYSFKIRSRNNLGIESAVSSYGFTILPPWYRTNLAYGLYAILFVGFNFTFFRWIRTKFRNQRNALQEEQRKQQYLYQLEMDKQEKEIVKLKNEKLEAEIALKNAELASATLHLVKKGDLLSKMKEDLTRQLKNDTASTYTPDLKKIVKAIGEDEKIDKDWDNFSTHFDKTHGDFLKMLKEKHPKLTAGDLKLCTYLRLNLASKDIAPLLNISVRSVELNRYRLRKKLEIPTEVNLFDYLMQVKPISNN